MRFKRADLLGIVVAAAIPAILSWVVFNGWGITHVHGNPIQGAIAGNVAAGAGLIAYLTRYVVHRRAFWTVVIGFVLCFVGVVWMQQTGSGSSGPATALKWLGILMFLGINVVLVIDVLWVAVNPYFVRLDERRAAGN